MIELNLDKSRLLRLRARVNEQSVPRKLIFQNEDGSAHDISGYDFKLYVFKRDNSTIKLFTLSVDDGLEVDTNELTITISAERAAQNAGTYFWRLYSVDEDHTWLNGPFVFHIGESDNVEEEEEINIYQNG